METLSKLLLDHLMTLACPICGHPHRRKGSWFKTAAYFRCEGCHARSPVTYEDKLRLFAEHARNVK
jgi:transposase-like protein